MDTPFAVILAVLVLLVAGAIAFSGGDKGGGSRRPATAARTPAPTATPTATPAGTPAPVRTIARRVERIRGLRFRRLPRAVVVSPAQARRDGLADLDRSYPARRRRADEEVLKLLGLLPPSVDLRRVSATVYGDAVAGYYDPRTKRLRIVRGAQTENRVLAEITLAHELTHALEDQRYGLGLGSAPGNDDAALARLALVEGSATEVMQTYGQRYFSAGQALGGVLASLGQDTGDLPPFIESQLVFPYLGGQRFVEALLRAGGGRPGVLNAAERFRPPGSTAQVLHPREYLEVVAPLRVRVAAGRQLGGGWRRLVAGTWGEWATGELLSDPGAAAGWRGDRYELWQRGGGACRAPCRPRDALVMRWRMGTPAAGARLRAALHGWLARRRATGAIAGRGSEATLALAPSPPFARRLARAG